MPERATRWVISACLWGCHCRHDGASALRPALRERIPATDIVLLVCPEEFAGLGTPRTPFDLPTDDLERILTGRVRIRDHAGNDVTDALRAGLQRTMAAIEAFQPDRAILKDGSPSCGVRTTWIRGRKTTGRGLLAWLLERRGVAIEGVE